MTDQIVHIGNVCRCVRWTIRKELEGGARGPGEDLHVFMRAGAARGATTVVDEHVVALLLTLLLTISSRGIMGEAGKGGTCGNDVGEGEGRALAVEGRSGEKEESWTDNWVSVEN